MISSAIFRSCRVNQCRIKRTEEILLLPLNESVRRDLHSKFSIEKTVVKPCELNLLFFLLGLSSYA